jgi:hypothetical protein
VFVSASMVWCAVLPPVQISLAKRVTVSHQPVHLRAIHILLVTARQVPLLIFPAARGTKRGTSASFSPRACSLGCCYRFRLSLDPAADAVRFASALAHHSVCKIVSPAFLSASRAPPGSSPPACSFFPCRAQVILQYRQCLGRVRVLAQLPVTCTFGFVLLDLSSSPSQILDCVVYCRVKPVMFLSCWIKKLEVC